MGVEIKDLISEGRVIEKGLKYVPASRNVLRMYDVYRLENVDVYYNWKEQSIRFLHLYYPTDLERFVKYSEAFEKCFVPHYIANMIGVLMACEALPSDKQQILNEVKDRIVELAKVLELEKVYVGLKKEETIHLSCKAFHEWHAAACVLFDKWFYPTDEDWIKFQNISGDGNGYTLEKEFDKIYSSYKKLVSRLQDGRNLRNVMISREIGKDSPSSGKSDKISIFISYAHADVNWLERLKTHLKVLSRFSDSIEYWEDTKLRGGDRWRDEITSAINKANVAILLVSTAFLASDFISNNELPPILRKAEEEGTRILPLIVSPCAFEFSEISDFQAINSPDTTLAELENDAAIDRVFLELTKTIRSLVKS